MKLNNVTIAAVAGTKAIETLKAIKYSMRELEFDRAILITPNLNHLLHIITFYFLV